MYVMDAQASTQRTYRLGVASAMAGSVLLVWLAFAVEEDGLPGAARALAICLVVNGVALVLYAGLRAKGRSIEEAYRLGYDVGYENGFRAGYADQASDTVRRNRHHPAADDSGLRNGR